MEPRVQIRYRLFNFISQGLTGPIEWIAIMKSRTEKNTSTSATAYAANFKFDFFHKNSQIITIIGSRNFGRFKNQFY
jgi:hypothetical protein